MCVGGSGCVCVSVCAPLSGMLDIVILFNTVQFPAALCSVYFLSISPDSVGQGLPDGDTGAKNTRSFKKRLVLASTT